MFLNHKTEMGIQRMQNQEMGLVLSTDMKPRLKWIPELHQRFVNAVSQLGGADKATPKTLMRVMGVPGLTLYHLKSHLQKYRLGQDHQSDTCCDNKQEANFSEVDHGESEIRGDHISPEIVGGTHTQINGLQIAQALQMQMEAQKKFDEQMEVQRHLQLRIEAQGKYLQSVLKRAHGTLVGHKSSTVGIEDAKVEQSQLVTMVDTRCLSLSFSRLTETGDLSLQKAVKRSMKGTNCSMDSSLTSSESSGRKEEKRQKLESGDTHECNRTSVVLPWMKINPKEGNLFKTGSNNGLDEQKRSKSVMSDDTDIDQPSNKTLPTHKEKSGYQLRKMGLSTELDLNSQYHSETDSGWQELDLNCKGPEPVDESWKHFSQMG